MGMKFLHQTEKNTCMLLFKCSDVGLNALTLNPNTHPQPQTLTNIPTVQYISEQAMGQYESDRKVYGAGHGAVHVRQEGIWGSC